MKSQLTLFGLAFMLIVSGLAVSIPDSASAAISDPSMGQWMDLETRDAWNASSVLQLTDMTISITPESMQLVDGVLYAATNVSTLYKSTDYGVTWTLVMDFVATYGTASGLMTLKYSEVWDIWLCSVYGLGFDTNYLWRSTDLITWTPVETIIHLARPWDFYETEDGVLYHGTYGSSFTGTPTGYMPVRVSSDGGVTWTNETSILCYHIHSVGVGHDGTKYAAYGDPGAGPDTMGVYEKKVGGAWANTTTPLLMDSLFTSFVATEDTTIFGSDYDDGVSLIVYDGQNYTPIRRPGAGAGANGYYTFSMEYIDGVVYAIGHHAYPLVPSSVYEVLASPDGGYNWYQVFYSQTDDLLCMERIEGESGQPYIFMYAGYSTNTLYRFANIKQNGIYELMNGELASSAPITIESTYSTSAFIANGEYEFAFGRNGIRNPTVTLTAKSLTNLAQYNSFEGSWSSWEFFPTDLSHEFDSVNYTYGTQSVKLNMTNDNSGATIFRYRCWPTGIGSEGATYLTAFDARKSEDAPTGVISSVSGQAVGTGDTRFSTMVNLTTDWRTYSCVGTHVNSGCTYIYTVFYCFNSVNYSWNLDNIRQFLIPGNQKGVFNCVENFTYDVAKTTRNVSAIINGLPYSYGSAAWDDDEIIATINLTGDFYGVIPVSVSCDGLVDVSISGARLSYGHNLIQNKLADGFELLGGAYPASYLQLNDETYLYSGVENWVSSTSNRLRSPTPNAIAIRLPFQAIVTAGNTHLNITVWDVSAEVIAGWNVTSTTYSATFVLSGLNPTLGYRVYQDGGVIATGTGPSFSFTTTSEGVFEVVEWHGKQVSSLVVLTVNMVGLGMIVTVLASYVAPIARDIQEKRPIKPEKLTQNLIRTVIFIVVASLMWGVLHTIAIG